MKAREQFAREKVGCALWFLLAPAHLDQPHCFQAQKIREERQKVLKHFEKLQKVPFHWCLGARAQLCGAGSGCEGEDREVEFYQPSALAFAQGEGGCHGSGAARRSGQAAPAG